MSVTFQRSRVLEVLVKFGAGDFVYAGLDAAGVAVEERVDAAVPGKAAKSVVLRKAAMNLKDPCPGARSDSPAAVLKLRDAQPVRAELIFSGRSTALFAAMLHSDVPAVLGVDFIHHPAEDLPVGGCVTEPIHKDAVMNHLVYDDILPFGLRKVEGCAYPHTVISVPCAAEDVPPYLICHLPKEGAGARELEGDGRQRSLEAEGVELVVSQPYEGKVGNHFSR